MWGDEPYYGLGYDFDPTWFLSDEDRALEAEIIDGCQRVIRPLAIECDRTGRVPARQRRGARRGCACWR